MKVKEKVELWAKTLTFSSVIIDTNGVRHTTNVLMKTEGGGNKEMVDDWHRSANSMFYLISDFHSILLLIIDNFSNHMLHVSSIRLIVLFLHNPSLKQLSFWHITKQVKFKSD